MSNSLRKSITKNIQELAQALVSVKVPGKVLTDDISAGYVEVGKGNILRVEVGADTYVSFSDENDGGAVSITTSPAVKLTAGEHYLVCTEKYVRASANPVRKELLKA